jgi:predicted extracellular nuclease
MFNNFRILIISISISGFMFADVFMTELTDPQNSSDAGRYVELYNNGDSSVDFSTGWALTRWTNASVDPQTAEALTGTIAAGGFYIVCNNADKYNATYGLTCDQNFGTGDAADSNGDDNIALLGVDGSIVDMFGVAGEDGSGTGHEFEDGRAERAESNASASATWDETGWNIDNDSGGGDGNQYAPEGFDPGSWIGATSGGDTGGGTTTCEDATACNDGAAEACTYPSDDCTTCDGADLGGQDCAGVCGGSSVVGGCDSVCGSTAVVGGCDSVCGSTAVDDDCGICGGDGSSCAEPAANLFFSEHGEGSGNNKYFEVYNASDADVSLADYAFVNCSNACDDWEYTTSFADGAVVGAGDVWVVCHSSATWGTCSNGSSTSETSCGTAGGEWTVTSAGDNCDESRSLYHNGNDSQGLMHVTTSTLLDLVGDIATSNTYWDIAGVTQGAKDHTIVRKASVTQGSTAWATSAGTNSDDSEWVVLDKDTWDYMGGHPHDFSTAGCTDTTACNYNANASSDDGSCLFNDCDGTCGGAAVVDDCGTCGGDGSACIVNVTFAVDMNLEGVTGDVKVRTSTENGDYIPSDWFVMGDADGDLVYTYTMQLSTGVAYGFNFNDGGYESGDTISACGGGLYGNDRSVTPGDSDLTLDTVCWESCDACPEAVWGCTDEDAVNFDDNATDDDGSCMSDWPTPANLFFSEYAEGTSNNKYLEIYNATDGDVDLSGYSLSSCSNGCSDEGEWEYPDTVELTGTLASGNVYVVCHGSASDGIAAECDQTHTYLSNGDDVYALTQMGSGLALDVIGLFSLEDGIDGWDVAGVEEATKDNTLVRKASVTTGNPLWLDNPDSGEQGSAGSDADDSEWVVTEKPSATYTPDTLGSHPHDFAPACAHDGDANGDGVVNVSDVVAIVQGIIGNAVNDPCTSDVNDDGSVNVSDVVAIVGWIVGGRADVGDDAMNADIIVTNNTISMNADGYISGVQMTLSHGNDFSITLADTYISEYSTRDNMTTLIVVSVEESLNHIATYKGSFEVESVIVMNSNQEIQDITVVNLKPVELTIAGPNPFNPSTSLNVIVAEAGYVSVNVYNVVGQKVAMLLNGYMDANVSGYRVDWNASNLSSGVYLVRAETAGSISTQKLMLLK